MGDWSRSCRCRAQSWGWSFPIPAASRDAKVSSHLLDEVEAAVHGGVHLPASGQPCGDRPAAGSPSLSPPSTPWTRRVVRAGIEGSWWQFVLPWLSLTTHFWKSLRPLLIRALTKKGKIPQEKLEKPRWGETASPRTTPQPSWLGFGGVSCAFPEDFTPHFPPLTPQEPGPSLTCAGEVPALDGVTRAGVHPAGGFGVVAARDKDRGAVSTPEGALRPLPTPGQGSWHHGEFSSQTRGF